MKQSLNIRKPFKFSICSAILYQMLLKWVYSHHSCIQCGKKLPPVHFLVLVILGYQREFLSIEPVNDLPLLSALFPEKTSPSYTTLTQSWAVISDGGISVSFFLANISLLASKASKEDSRHSVFNVSKCIRLYLQF